MLYPYGNSGRQRVNMWRLNCHVIVISNRWWMLPSMLMVLLIQGTTRSATRSHQAKTRPNLRMKVLQMDHQLQKVYAISTISHQFIAIYIGSGITTEEIFPSICLDTVEWVEDLLLEVVRNQMVLPCVEWWGKTDNWATTPFSYCPSTTFLPVLAHCVNARWNRCQQDLNSFPLVELEETTWTPSYYVDED